MSEKAPGFEEYTPSRLEWLAMMLNSFLPYTNIPLTGTLNIIFVPGAMEKRLY